MLMVEDYLHKDKKNNRTAVERFVSITCEHTDCAAALAEGWCPLLYNDQPVVGRCCESEEPPKIHLK